MMNMPTFLSGQDEGLWSSVRKRRVHAHCEDTQGYHQHFPTILFALAAFCLHQDGKLAVSAPKYYVQNHVVTVQMYKV